MDYDFKVLASGKSWLVQWKSFQREESISLTFDSDTVLDSSVMEAIRKYGAWHLYCRRDWSGADMSVFTPVADVVTKLSLPAEKSTKIVGLDCLMNLETLSISGDLAQVDFTKLTKLRSLTVTEWCKGGNWHLCKSLEVLRPEVPMANFKKLNALKNLQSLSCGRGLKSFEGLADLPVLRELLVGNTHLASLESLGHLPSLRYLLLNLMPKLQSLHGIEGLTHLEELEVTQCGGLRDVSDISALPNLKRFTLSSCPHMKTLAGVKVPQGCGVDFAPGGKVGDEF